MTFLERSDVIKENDVIIAYVSPADMKPLTCIKDGVFRNRYGEFCHNGMIGKRFGVKYPSKNSHGFIYLLYPTPELWTLVLPHRTQILYNADISLITMLLELKPGSKMIEAGTGSGSFSHAIARTIYPNGKLFTFEYHQDRQKIAEQEFKEHCLDSIIVCSFGDVCRNGFGDIEPVDCVFLDLPSPWEALEHAKNAFKTDEIGRICCFSPSMEQVQLTCTKLHELGFTEIRMFECLERDHDVRSFSVLHIPSGQEFVRLDNQKKRPAQGEEPGLLTTKVQSRVRGHTSFLTFASLYPETS